MGRSRFFSGGSVQQHVQLEVLKTITSCAYCPPNQKPGDVIWVTPAQATELIANKLARYVGAGRGVVAGPSETPEAAPSEIKKNHSGAPTDGPSIASPSSNGGGKATRSSVSAGVLVLPHRT